MNTWHLLPEEMQAKPFWVCADDDKQPRNALTGQYAAVDDATTWSSFKDACRAALANGWEIGFVLNPESDLAIVDLDDKPHKPAPEQMKRVHADMVNRADTYIERSTSGTGYHIIVRGKPIRPIKSAHLEVYGTRRMMICTGDVVKEMAIADGGPLLAAIDQHFGHLAVDIDPTAELPDTIQGKEENPDAAIIRMAMEATNGDKFLRLWQGDIETDCGGDHSGADQALINMLCFYTPHNEQVRRLFRASGLYRPHQTNRRSNAYIDRSIKRWRAENPPLDLESFKIDLPKKPKVPKAPVAKIPSAPIPSAPEIPPSAPIELEFPPGIIGDIADYAYRTSYMPVRPGALAAAIGYIAGLVGRGFHINGLGLNQYIVFIADSGVGKEGGKKAIRAVHNHVYAKVPAAQHAISSADFSAGVTLVKELAHTPSMLAIAGEIGMSLGFMLDPKANTNLKDLKRALTEAWSESGPNGVLNSRRYSDRSKNSEDVKRPALSLLGESVPSLFYGALTQSAALDGFIPRFIVMEYTGQRPYANRDAEAPPPAPLVEKVQDLFIISKALQDSNQMSAIQVSEVAKRALWKFEDETTDRMRQLPAEHPSKAILNRTNEKVLKIAGLLAVCDNPTAPCVSMANADWAMRFVTDCDAHMLEKFEDGTVGEDESSFQGEIMKLARSYILMDEEKREMYRTPKSISGHNPPILVRAFLADQLKRRAAFKNHPAGAIRAVDIALAEAEANGLLIPLPPLQAKTLGLQGGKAWLIGSHMLELMQVKVP